MNFNKIKLSKIEFEKKCRKAANDLKSTIPKPKGMVNPELDHIVPIDFGYKHNISWQTLSLPENFVWIPREENRSKSDNLTEAGKTLLKQWYQENRVDMPIGQDTSFVLEYDFSKIIAAKGMTAAEIPLQIALSQKPVWCQRDETLRWEKTKNALGRVALDTHRVMQFVVYPDGTIERVDGNTRCYLWRNNLQFFDYEVPDTILGIFYKVKDRVEAEIIYHSIDSTATAETFAEKLSGYIRHNGYADNLPRKWKKGESVYDITVVALDNYIAPGETQYAFTPAKSINDAEKAAATSEALNYLIKELVIIGNLINKDNMPRHLTSPLIGMMIRYLMKYPNCEKTYEAISVIVNYLVNDKYSSWSRPASKKNPQIRNLYIMMDELQTSDDISGTNPYVKFETSSRRILEDRPTRTTSNIQDRRIYCGWVVHCMEKYINGEVMDEDIIFDVIGEKTTNNTTALKANANRSKAQSSLMTKYDYFWK